MCVCECTYDLVQTEHQVERICFDSEVTSEAMVVGKLTRCYCLSLSPSDNHLRISFSGLERGVDYQGLLGR